MSFSLRNPAEVQRKSKPRIGDPITYRDQVVGHVISVDGTICWRTSENPDREAQPFIWCFHDGLNHLHDWPGKDKSQNCKD